jgi:hypothetical protein
MLFACALPQQALRDAKDAVDPVIMCQRHTYKQATGCLLLSTCSLLFSPSLIVESFPATACALPLQSLRDDKDAVESEIASLAAAAAKDLGLILDKTVKLEWHKVRRMYCVTTYVMLCFEPCDSHCMQQ